MAFIDLTKSCLDSIRQISEHVEGAVLYLDAGCTESLQYMGAFPLLLDLGVRAVCSLEDMSSLDAGVDWTSKTGPARKFAVITSRLLSDAHRYILRCLSTHQGVRSCAIFTSISEIAHSAYPDSPLGPDAFHEYKSLLIQDYEELVKKQKKEYAKSEDSNPIESSTSQEGWSKFSFDEEEASQLEVGSFGRDIYEDERQDVGQKLAVFVHHFPMMICPFSRRVFVLPSEGSTAEAYLSVEREDSLSPGLPPLSTGSLFDTDDVPPGATLTAHFLYHLAAKMDLKMEIFSFGDLSKAVGKMLTDMSSLYDVGRRKRSVGLLLIDRTLDLLTPCCHGDSLMDRIFSSLPRRERPTPSAHLKGSQTRLKLDPFHLKRAPLDIKIPLANILSGEDLKLDKLRLIESIEAFMQGWNSENTSSQILDLGALRSKVEDVSSDMDLLDGCFVSTENFRGTPYLEAMLDRRTRDGSILVKKWLQEALRREKITTNVKVRPGSATKSELTRLVKALAINQKSLIRNRGIIQLAAATIHALNEDHSARWDAFISAEKILRVNAGDTSQGLASQIGDLVNKSALSASQSKNQGLLCFQDALLLAVVGYILAGENFPTSGSIGPFSWQEEHLLKEAIVDAILENPQAAELKFLNGLTEELEANFKKIKQEETKESLEQSNNDDFDDDQWDSWGDEDNDTSKNTEQVYGNMQLKLELRDRVDNLFKSLHKFSSMASKNKPLREGVLAFESDMSFDPDTSRGLLYKLLVRILGKNDIPGLEYHSSTVGRLFKSGFGRFGLGQAKPNLADQNIILVFVIGGINGLEVREAQEALSESGRPDIELILGGTTFLTPNNMLDLLLGHYSYT